eukprot:2389013-Amphidinium_carterae.1
MFVQCELLWESVEVFVFNPKSSLRPKFCRFGAEAAPDSGAAARARTQQEHLRLGCGHPDCRGVATVFYERIMLGLRPSSSWQSMKSYTHKFAAKS